MASTAHKGFSLHGPEGLRLYEDWRRRRGVRAPWIADWPTLPFDIPSANASPKEELNFEKRLAVHMAKLDRLYPQAKLPTGPDNEKDWLQRAWWLGISLGQAATLRAHNRAQHNLCWP